MQIHSIAFIKYFELMNSVVSRHTPDRKAYLPRHCAAATSQARAASSGSSYDSEKTFRCFPFGRVTVRLAVQPDLFPLDTPRHWESFTPPLA